ncbi:MAG: hypothetical protein FJX76_14710 [Armatimonadetes bacterium]|nr:hypothetical protein [Armatimonadota bacterium]
MNRTWERWKQLAQRAATFQARALLTVFYYTVLVPFGLVVSLFGDPLRIRHKEGGWTPVGPVDPWSQG